MSHNKDILQQIENAKKSIGEMNSKKNEMHNLLDKMDFSGNEDLKSVLNDMKKGDKDSLKKAMNILNEKINKL